MFFKEGENYWCVVDEDAGYYNARQLTLLELKDDRPFLLTDGHKYLETPAIEVCQSKFEAITKAIQKNNQRITNLQFFNHELMACAKISEKE